MGIPTIVEIQSRLINDFKKEFNLTKIEGNSFLFIFSYVIAAGFFGLYYFANKMLNNLFLDRTTDDDYILRWGEFLGVSRKFGSESEGIVHYLGEGTLPTDITTIILTNSSGEEYSVEDVLSDKKLKIKAKEIGKDKDLSGGSELFFQSTIEGIEPVVTVEEAGLTGGSDQELMKEYQERLLSIVRTIQTGGNKQDYINWGLEVDGVEKVFVFDNYGGTGNVGLSFITNNRDNFIPNDTQLQKMTEAIETNKPFGAIVHIFAPTKRELNLKINLTPNTAEVRENVTNNIKELLKLEADLGGIIATSKISEAISLASGEEKHILENPQDYQMGKWEVATLGDIEWTG